MQARKMVHPDYLRQISSTLMEMYMHLRCPDPYRGCHTKDKLSLLW